VNIYFDTNVYRFIGQQKEAPAVRRLLKAYQSIVTASAGNLFETFAITSSTERSNELEVITRVAQRFTPKPASWLHAIELRNELRAKRPSWIRRITTASDMRRVRQFLRSHNDLWNIALEQRPLEPHDYSIYHDDAEGGISAQREFQKSLRDRRSELETAFFIKDALGQASRVNVSDPEVYWRVTGLMVWYNAIEGHVPASRDYADWLSPYLKPRSFRDPSYKSFWLKEASADTMPLNRLTGLVDFYQLQEKITHGNAGDQIHATHWFHSDLFVTADHAFYAVLKRISDIHLSAVPKPALIDRSAPSCVAQLEAILSNRSIH